MAFQARDVFESMLLKRVVFEVGNPKGHDVILKNQWQSTPVLPLEFFVLKIQSRTGRISQLLHTLGQSGGEFRSPSPSRLQAECREIIIRGP